MFYYVLVKHTHMQKPYNEPKIVGNYFNYSIELDCQSTHKDMKEIALVHPG